MNVHSECVIIKNKKGKKKNKNCKQKLYFHGGHSLVRVRTTGVSCTRGRYERTRAPSLTQIDTEYDEKTVEDLHLVSRKARLERVREEE